MPRFNQPNMERKKCAWTTLRENIGDVYCPTCRNEKCVYISTNKTTSFYDCKKCKACCNVLNIPFRAQKPTIMLLAVTVHIALPERRVATTRSHLHF